MSPGEISALEQDRDWYRLQRDEERMRLERLARAVLAGDARALAVEELERLK